MSNLSSKQLSDIRKVLKEDLCIACGACIEACPFDNIYPVYHEPRGSHEVAIKDDSLCANCQHPCEDVCPSISIDYEFLLKSLRELKIRDRIGPINSVYTGFSSEFQYNGVSSSGGVIRLIIKHFLQEGIPVVTLVDENNNYIPKLIKNIEEMKFIPGSIYHNVSFTSFISEIRKCVNQCIVIATPCQLEGLFLYCSKEEPLLFDKIFLSVGLICGWMFSDHMINAFASFKNIEDPVINTTYRGEDKTGCLKLKTSNKTYRYHRKKFSDTKSRIDYSSSFSSASNRLRCRLCENHINLLSDISVGDAWLKRFPEEKLSLIVTRTNKGQELITSLARCNTLLIEEASINDIYESQSENLVYGIDAQLFKKYLHKKKFHVPVTFFTQEETNSNLLPDENDQLCYRIELHLRWMLRNKEYLDFRNMYWNFMNFKSSMGRKPLTIKERFSESSID